MMNGKVLCLRGGHEHKDLKLSLFSFGKEGDREFLAYTGNGSKNRSGRYKGKAENKIIKHFSDSSLLYLSPSNLPKKATTQRKRNLLIYIGSLKTRRRCLLVYYASMQQEFPCISCQEHV